MECSTIEPGLYLPNFYQQCGSQCERNEVIIIILTHFNRFFDITIIQHLLLNLYFAITLEKLQLNAMQLPHVMNLLETVSQVPIMKIHAWYN